MKFLHGASLLEHRGKTLVILGSCKTKTVQKKNEKKQQVNLNIKKLPRNVFKKSVGCSKLCSGRTFHTFISI